MTLDPVAAQAVSGARQCDIQSNRWDNGNGPSRCVNTDQGLTRSSGTSREGMASMIATHSNARISSHLIGGDV